MHTIDYKMSCGLSVLIAILLFITTSGQCNEMEKSPLPIRVAVVDNCLLTSAGNVQMGTYAESMEAVSSDFSVMCGMNNPYIFSLESDGGVILTTQIQADDGFGYQYHVEVDEDGNHVVETCDSLAEVPVSDQVAAASMLQANTDQSSTESNGTVTINISW